MSGISNIIICEKCEVSGNVPIRQRIRFQYYKDMHSSVLAAVDNDDTQPLKKVL